MLNKIVKHGYVALIIFILISLCLFVVRLLATYRFYGPETWELAFKYSVSPWKLLPLKIAAAAAGSYYLNTKAKYAKSKTLGTFLVSLSGTWIVMQVFLLIIEPASKAELMEVLAFGGFLLLGINIFILVIGLGILITPKLLNKI